MQNAAFSTTAQHPPTCKMYELVGELPGARRLADLAGQLHPQPSREGYATTDREKTRVLYEQHVSPYLPGEWTKCFLAIIWPNGTIPPHRDGDSIREGSKRFQVVLQTNDQCWNLHDRQWQQLVQDGIYTMQPDLVHASVNWGSEPRILLIADVTR